MIIARTLRVSRANLVCYSDSMLQFLSARSSTQPISVAPSLDRGAWIRCEKPSSDEIDQLISLGLDADLIADALDPHEVPRVEQADSIVYLITRVPDVGDEFNSFTTPIMFAVTRNHVVTLSRDSLGRLWQPFLDKTRVATSSQTQLLLLMLDMISQQFYARVSAINRETRAVTSDVGLLGSKDIATLVQFERKLNDYLDALIPANTATEKLLGGKFLKLSEDDRDLIEDLSVDLEQVILRCKSLLRTITNVRDSYRAVMDTRLNETIRLLTVITLAVTIPTMISGLFGMNVNLPPEVQSPLTFWLIAGTSLAISLGLVYYFLRRRR